MKPLLKWGLFLYVLLIGWLNVRERVQMHPDEVYSVMLAQCNPAYCKGIEPGTYTGERLQRELIAAHPVSEDIASLYADNRDVPHASLYYMTLRIVLGDTTRWDPVRIVRTGGLLNLFFLAVAYLMLWSLMSRLTRGSPWLTAACVAMAMLGPGTLECGALLREYQLSMLGIVWYAYALFLLFEKPEMSGRQLFISGISLSFSAALCLSTGYLNSFCLLLLPLGCIAALLAGKAPRRHISRFTVTALSAGFCSLLIARVMYAGFFNFLTHGSVHKSRAFGSIDGVFDAAFVRDIVGLHPSSADIFSASACRWHLLPPCEVQGRLSPVSRAELYDCNADMRGIEYLCRAVLQSASQCPIQLSLPAAAVRCRSPMRQLDAWSVADSLLGHDSSVQYVLGGLFFTQKRLRLG